MNRIVRLITLAAVLPLSASLSLYAQHSEHWSGFATVHGQHVPVHVQLSGSSHDGAVAGGFVNAKQFSPASSGTLAGGHLTLTFDYFARKLEGDIKDGTFTGTYSVAKGDPYPIELHEDAAASEPAPAAAEKAANAIRGDWEIAVQAPTAKGESAWTMHVTPLAHGEIKVVIQRIDGDTNGLYGAFDPETHAYRVSHFSAAGPALYSIKPQADGTLLVSNDLRDGQQGTARRPAEARKENLAPPTKATEQTSVVDATKPFSFSAPDLNGKIVSNTDPALQGKVVIVAIGGSWCPNCHDEAPFLVDLYHRYHARGLEIVDLSFEEESQLKNPQRLRAFVAKYHIPYTVLIAGTPDQLNEKLPQGKNLNCWPTTFFLGRNGRVQQVHAGFSGPETGEAYVQLKAETDKLISRLLAQRDVAIR